MMAGMAEKRRGAGDDLAASPDPVLAAAARAGDQQAFTVLLQRHDGAMRRLAYRLLADATAMDDVLQEAYVKAYKALGTYRTEAAFGSWLYRITYNACIDEIRRARRRPGPPPPEPVEPASPLPGPERTVTAAETVRAALAALPADQRVTVVLVDGEGFDNAAAARILGVAPGTVASRLSRARAALRHLIGEVDG